MKTTLGLGTLLALVALQPVLAADTKPSEQSVR